jgi:hypothetical protein
MTDPQTKTVLRYEVPIDDRPHTFPLTYTPHAVAAKRIGATHRVEFWAEHDDGLGAVARSFQVFGTGHPIPATARLRGTAERLDDLVWHLYEVYPEPVAGGER